MAEKYDRRADRSRDRGGFHQRGGGHRGGGPPAGDDARGRRPQQSTVASAKAGPINVVTNHFRLRLAGPADKIHIYSCDFGARDPGKVGPRAQALNPVRDSIKSVLGQFVFSGNKLFAKQRVEEDIPITTAIGVVTFKHQGELTLDGIEGLQLGKEHYQVFVAQLVKEVFREKNF